MEKDIDLSGLDGQSLGLAIDVGEVVGLWGDNAVPKAQRAAAAERAMTLIEAGKTMARCTPAESAALERLIAHLRGDAE